MLATAFLLSFTFVVYEDFFVMPFNTNSSGSDQPEECQPLDPSDEVRITAQMRTVRYPGRGPIMNQYERRQRIGRGQHGEVHVGVDLNTGSWVVSTRSSSLSYYA